MEGFITVAVRLIQAGKRIGTKKWSFFGVFAFTFLGSILVLGQLDLLPDATKAPRVSSNPSVILGTTTSAFIASVELPMKIEIQKINLSATISNPTTTDIVFLDKELLKGAVRYPTSAKLGEIGNVVLFGHSSYLPIVKNQVYKTFNGIQKLSPGDVVTVYSSATVYTYRVRNVAEEKADDNTAIPLSVVGKVLTLVTCNSFGAKEDRFVMTADFVDSYPVST